MDFNNNNPYAQQNNSHYSNNRNQYIRNPGQTMATASLVLGITSMLTLFTIYLPIALGSTAVILAILSKGYGKKMLPIAKIGIGTAAGGMTLIIALFVSLIGFISSLSGDTLVEFGRQVDQQFEQQTGQEIEDFAGTSYEEIMKMYAEMIGK